MFFDKKLAFGLFLRESCVICNSTVSLDVVVQALKLLPYSFTAGVMSP